MSDAIAVRLANAADAPVLARHRAEMFHGIARLVLHASPDGRALYERLSFEPTNDMRYTGELPGTP